jgi:hypothetical protein
MYDVSLQRGSGVRKATGTFYTPLPIADYLVRRTLGPLVRQASPDHILSLRILDPAMGSGAFLVAACRYLATAYETALLRSGGCHASDIGEQERALVRRTIAERCLYGVDVNPMAVQARGFHSGWPRRRRSAADVPRPSSSDAHSLLGTWLTARSNTWRRRLRRTFQRFRRRNRPKCPQVDAVRSRSSPFPTTPSKTFARREALARLNRRDTGLSR